ncbi:MAG: amino acid ABC transporter permease [Bacillota bacterium]|jgi:His/Glu/Gln/Arg/opine family amino acid ABC transporter permease subunit
MINFIDKFLNINVFSEVWPFLLEGLLVTVELAIITLVTSMIVGLIAALLKISRIKIVSQIVSAYINIFRGTPLLVQIIIIFYALPDLGINLDRFPAGILALTLNNGAYVAEILRGGIESIPKGQKEAAQSLGLNYFQCMYKVILPQAFKNSLPALTNSFVALLKDTSLVSVVGVTELLKQGRQLQTWKANSTPLMGVAILYFIVIWPFIMLVDYLEKRLKKS